MTPCQRRGYKVGDEFVVTSVGGQPYPKGTEIRLIKDDGTGAPLFEQITGVKRGNGVWFEALSAVKLISRLIEENE